ncbi:MAG: hypothetical protein DSM106950_20225 [Stigonema ocellatum SAG 48.90 = DSM 106950]|nr:hypothetical protein [Stigonema ocellatum SAG 48.90 = DSM 106950]
MKDNMSLIAAAAGGFMLSVALSAVLRGTPVVSWQQQSSFRPATVSDLQLTSSSLSSYN